MKTTFPGDWDRWEIGDVTLSTTFSNDWDRWEIRGHGKVIEMRTTFNEDFERWDISGDIEGTISTVFSENYERWEVDIGMEGLHKELQISILFVAIITAFHVVG